MSSFTVTTADFDNTLTLTNIVTGASQSIPYQYCATPASAARLLAHLNSLGLHPTPSLDFPYPGWPPNNIYSQSTQVPYLDFTNATTGAIDHENVAGILIEYMLVGQTVTDYNCVNRWFAGDN